MGRSQLNQILLLSISNQGMMMVQPQATLCQDSTLMTLLEGPFTTPWRQWGETKGKSHQKSGRGHQAGRWRKNPETHLYLVQAMANWRKSYPTTNLWIIWKLQPMMTTRSVMICSSLQPSLDTRDQSSQQTPIGKDASIMSMLIESLGRRLMNPSHSWQQIIL